MKRVMIFLAAILLMHGVRVNAQDQDNLEKLTAFKIAFFTERLNLTPGEAEKFWPLYNDFSARKTKIQADRKLLMQYAGRNEANMSDQELTEAANKLAQSFVDEANLVVSFNKEIQKVLPPAKVIKLYQTENQYKQQLLKQLNERRQDQGPARQPGQFRNNRPPQDS